VAGSQIDNSNNAIDVTIGYGANPEWAAVHVRIDGGPVVVAFAGPIGLGAQVAGRSPFDVTEIGGDQATEMVLRVVRTQDGGWVGDAIDVEVWASEEGDGFGVTYVQQSFLGPGAPPPAGDVFTVTNAGAIAPDGEIQFDVGEANRFAVWVEYASGLVEMLLWSDPNGVQVGAGMTLDLFDGVTLTRDAGWPEDFTLWIVCGDNASAGLSYAYTVPGGEGFPATDAIAPEVSNVSPAPGVAITAQTPVGFDVTDNRGAFRRVLVAALFPATGVTELVHDGDTFLGPYAPRSTRNPIAGGFRLSVLRDGGWPSSPTLRIFAFDTTGNEV
jgi:hypothetical protein